MRVVESTKSAVVDFGTGLTPLSMSFPNPCNCYCRDDNDPTGAWVLS